MKCLIVPMCLASFVEKANVSRTRRDTYCLSVGLYRLYAGK